MCELCNITKIENSELFVFSSDNGSIKIFGNFDCNVHKRWHIEGFDISYNMVNQTNLTNPATVYCSHCDFRLRPSNGMDFKVLREHKKLHTYEQQKKICIKYSDSYECPFKQIFCTVPDCQCTTKLIYDDSYDNLSPYIFFDMGRDC
jgi:hypothetical protein